MFFLRKYVFFFLTREKKTTFSHTWCHDFSWFVPLDDSNPFIDTSLGSIPLSTLHVVYTSTPLALAGSSRKKGPDALGTCRTTLSVITVNLESLDDFSPIFHWEKMILDCQSPTNSRTKVSTKITKSWKINRNFQFFIISDDNSRVCAQKMPKTHI